MENFNQFKDISDTAYHVIEEALCLDEKNGSKSECMTLYRYGLMLIAQVIAFNTSTFEENEQVIVNDILQKIKYTQENTINRLIDLDSKTDDMQESCYNLYPSLTALRETDRDLVQENVSKSLQGSKNADFDFVNDQKDAELLFEIPSGARVFFVTQEGLVSSSSESFPLKIYLIKACDDDENSSDPTKPKIPPAFLHIGNGSWVYPLYPDKSPILQANVGEDISAYILPDLTAPDDASSIGILFTKSVSKDVIALFESILKKISFFKSSSTEFEKPAPIEKVNKTKESAPNEQAVVLCPSNTLATTEYEEDEKNKSQITLAEKLSNAILSGSCWLANAVQTGSSRADNVIKEKGEKIKSEMKPGEEEVNISRVYMFGASAAHLGSRGAVKVTKFAVDKLGDATVALGRALANQIKKRTPSLIPQSLLSKEKAEETVNAVLDVTESGIKGFSVVYVSLENAAKTIACSLSNETINIIDHKYGDQARQFSEKSIGALGNSVMTGYNIHHLGPKSLAVRTMKHTGMHILSDAFEVRDKTRSDSLKSDKVE